MPRPGRRSSTSRDAKIIKLYVDDEPLFLPTAYLGAYERVLDFRSGTLEQRLLWDTASGKRVEVFSRRLVSLRYRHLAAFQFEVRVLNGDAPVVISSQFVNRADAGAPDEPWREFDPRVRKLDWRVLEKVLQRVAEQRLLFGYRTGRSRMTLGCGVDHVIDTNCAYEVVSDVGEDVGMVTYIVEATEGPIGSARRGTPPTTPTRSIRRAATPPCSRSSTTETVVAWLACVSCSPTQRR